MTKKKIIEKKPEEISYQEKPIEVKPELSEVKEGTEKEEQLQIEKIKKLREKIENTELDDHLKMQVESHVNDLAALEGENKLKKLLEIVKMKGVIFTVNIAKKMDDPYLLDMLHDRLAKEGYYKDFKL